MLWKKERGKIRMFRVVAVLQMGLLLLFIPIHARAGASVPLVQQGENQNGQVLVVPNRRRRARGDVRRRRGIGSAFSKAGKSAGRGGKRFGKHVSRGRPARGGKEFCKGMGGFGKHFGKGMSRVGKRIVSH